MIGASTSLILALAWAGVQYSWSSTQTLVPLILGVVSLIAFMCWEAKFAVEPVVPWVLVSNRTNRLGYVTVFWHGLTTTTGICEFAGYLGENLRSSLWLMATDLLSQTSFQYSFKQ